MYIRSGRLTLTRTVSDDAELKQLFDDYDDLRFMSELRLHGSEMPSTMSFRVIFKKKLIGEVSLKNIKWLNRKAEISVMISNEFQHQGFGREAVLRIIHFSFDTLNFYRLEAQINHDNFHSIKMFECLGFVKEGVLRKAKYIDGEYHDIIQYGLLKPEFNPVSE
ncbi:MAG: GNAT family protein [Bacteroidales bacterium]|jgi:RimJ/RimL family protein N-acetyltransferase|nr:GNAT family protein [Bacteroidales bacterium]